MVEMNIVRMTIEETIESFELTLELEFLSSLEVEDVISHDSSRVVFDEKLLQNEKNEDD